MTCAMLPAGKNNPFYVVLLAAGEGSRMGYVPKSLFRLENETLLARQIHALAAAGAIEIILVTGYYHHAIEAEALRIILDPNLADTQNHDLDSKSSEPSVPRIKVVRNPEPDQGQQSSVELGLQALQLLCFSARFRKNDSVDLPIMVALADQPLMKADDYRACIQAFHSRPVNKSIVYPIVAQRRGNPVVFCPKTLHSVLAGDQSCKDYIDAHSEYVHQYLTENDHYVFDLDETKDLERFLQRTGLILTPPADL